MFPDEVNSIPQHGQLYGVANPLCLARFSGSGDASGSWSFTAFYPFGIGELYVIPPFKISLLWYDRSMYVPREDAKAYRVGAVYLSKKKGRLFFIGPPKDKDKERLSNFPTVRILADWDAGGVELPGPDLVLYQPGPERHPEDPETETRFEKVTKDERNEEGTDRAAPHALVQASPAGTAVHARERREE